MTLKKLSSQKSTLCCQNPGTSYSRFMILKGKKILSIDYGLKVVGLAIFDHDQDPYPTPYGRIIFHNNDQVLSDLQNVIKSEDINFFVLGLPLHKDGNPSEMSENVRLFGHKLSDFYPQYPIYYQDEYLSSFEAKERMKNSARYQFKVNPKEIDALAASIILEDFLKQSCEVG